MNYRNTPIHLLRTAVWLTVLRLSSGISKADHIELEILHRLHIREKKADNLSAFENDGRKPFKITSHPYPEDAVWPERAAQCWPETDTWFFTPLWFLLEETKPCSSSQLFEYIKLLPLHHREMLLENDEGVNCERNLFPVQRGWIYEFTNPISPWSLGAMACAMRRAEISGDIETMWWCAAGLVWLLIISESWLVLEE